MPAINDFLTQFGWPEFWITIIISAVIVGIRERHHFFKKGQRNIDIKSTE